MVDGEFCLVRGNRRQQLRRKAARNSRGARVNLFQSGRLAASLISLLLGRSISSIICCMADLLVGEAMNQRATSGSYTCLS